MADWYVSSAAWTAITQFAASGVYTLGQIVRPLTAPIFSNQHVFRCTTAGTAATEPTWPTANNSTVTTGGATFTNVTSQGTYGWGAAAGTLFSICQSNARASAGDRVFIASDHLETNSSTTTYTLIGNPSFGSLLLLSVNRAGSVPPTATDLTQGATLETTSNTINIDNYVNQYWFGITFKVSYASANNSYIQMGWNDFKTLYFDSCSFWLNNTYVNAWLRPQEPCRIVFDNTNVRFGNVGHSIVSMGYPGEFIWIRSAGPINGLGSIPSRLFVTSYYPGNITFRGVDLSVLTTTLLFSGPNTWSNSPGGPHKFLLDSCQISPSLVRLDTTVTQAAADEVELINCFDGTNILSERRTSAGDVTTEFGTFIIGGAQDNAGFYSHKMVTNTRSDKYVMTLDSFWMDLNYTVLGTSKTATVEIVSSAALNTDEISLFLEYEGLAGTSLAVFSSSTPATVLTAPSAVATSIATWNNPPSTPAYQKLQVTFTPRTAGRLRAMVRLGKPSTTVWVNPQITVT